MIPIRDENRALTTPYITRFLIVVNVIIFLITWLLSPDSLVEAIWNYGMIPANILQGERLYTLFTSMFLHGDILHLGGNMLYLYIFGDNVEDAFGHGRYVAFYFLSGIIASMMHIVMITKPEDLLLPAIGASGAISGVLGAYLMLYPKARVLTLVLIRWIYITSIPAIFVLGFWFVFQLLYGVLAFGLGALGEVAYWAHIGGFIAGIVLGLTVRGWRKPRIQY